MPLVPRPQARLDLERQLLLALRLLLLVSLGREPVQQGVCLAVQETPLASHRQVQQEIE